MKKIVLFLMSALVLVGCNKSDFTTYTTQEIKDAQYAEAFEKTFGTPAPTQTWGNWEFDVPTAKAFTRAANEEGNIWYLNWERPYNVNLSPTEINELKALLTKTQPTENIDIFPYENYWVEQIYKGESSYLAYDNNGKVTTTSVTSSNQMDHLQARDGDHYTHINNFNYGDNQTVMVDEGNGQRYVGITLMKDMSLNGITANNQFGYSESWGTENGKFYNNYLIVQYKGEWYVGFDFEAHKSTATHNNGEAMQVNRDWAFTDWIVRISPAVAKETPLTPATEYDNAKRIMCEDLGAIGDFDFNDVVFDAFIGYIAEKGQNGTVITIQCAGGVLPLTVAGVEVHSALGVPSGTMVNTSGSEGNVTAEPYTFFTTETFDYSAKNIPVVVKDNSGAVLEINAEVGEAPQKFCTSPRTRWAKGRVNIKDAYPQFIDWVHNGSNEYHTPWIDYGVDELLY